MAFLLRKNIQFMTPLPKTSKLQPNKSTKMANYDILRSFFVKTGGFLRKASGTRIKKFNR